MLRGKTSPLPVRVPAARRAGRWADRVTPRGSARLIRPYWKMLWRVTRTEMSARFAGSFIGAGWVLLTPGLILAIYSAIYLTVFKEHVPGLSSEAFVVFLFSGLVPYLVTAEALSTGVTSIVTNKTVLSNTVFPIDLAPVKAVLAAQGTMAVGMVVAVIGSIITDKISWLIVFLPLVCVLHMLALIGVTWIISLLNVIVRDLQSGLNAVLMILLIASPIVYSPNQVPHALKIVLALNPLAYFIVAYQEVIVTGYVPTWEHTVGLFVLSLGLFCAGSIFFARAKKALLDYA